MGLVHSIPLNSISNARELGGYHTADGKTVRRGLLLRTAKLYDISGEDIRTLTEDYRLEHIVDFRLQMEIADCEDPQIEGAQYHWIDVIEMPEVEGEETPDLTKLDVAELVQVSEDTGMLDEHMYIGFLDCEKGKKAYADFFRILLSADSDRAVLWHCTSGKDRTGLAAMLLLSALGVDEQTVVDDYLLTNLYNAQQIAGVKMALTQKGFDEAFIAKAVIVFAGVNEQVMRTAIEYLKKKYGSVVGYLKDALHITEDEIEALKEKYLQ